MDLADTLVAIPSLSTEGFAIVQLPSAILEPASEEEITKFAEEATAEMRRTVEEAREKLATMRRAPMN